MEIVLSTGNEGKVREIRDLLRGVDVEIVSLKDFPQAPVVRETGSSFKENALIKAGKIASFTNKVTIADDSGLEVDVLNGMPGIYSARFAGENASDDQNNTELLRRLERVPISRRGATFKCVIAVVNPGGEKIVVEGECRGVITSTGRGDFGFGYDPIFLATEYGKTFAELPPEIKNKISHRARAMMKLKGVLEECIREHKKI